jgi:hypothetical protein
MHGSHPPGSPGGRWRAMGVALAVALVSISGCGVAAESEPEAVTTSPTSPATPGRPQSTGVVEIYLVRDGHLVAVSRAGRSAADALSALAVGPTDIDVEAHLGSPLPALPVTLFPQQDPAVVTIDVPAEFATLPPRDRLLAAAQLVWTATDACCATQVQMLLDDRPLPVPTDEGSTTRPLRRSDYSSVAPV